MPFFLLTILLQLCTIASLFPDIAPHVPWASDPAVLVQFPLMGLACVAIALWSEAEESLGAKLARLSLTLGITFSCLLLFSTFGLSIGPANPFAAPASASLQTRALWFVGFTAIASIGFRFFIASSIIDISVAIAAPLKRSPILAFALATVLGAALGAGAIALLHSEMVTSFASKAQSEIDANPAPYLIGFLIGPLLLGAIARGLKKRK